VKEKVVFEVGVFGKAPRTNVTLERPRSGVDVHVRAEISRSWKRLAAEIAFVRLVLKQQIRLKYGPAGVAAVSKRFNRSKLTTI
jgi:hypothetical protein